MVADRNGRVREPLPLPRHLRETLAAGRDPALTAWTGRLPVTVAELARRWALSVGEPFEPGGLCSWVAPVIREDGTDAVLKVGFRHAEAEHEAEALRFWNGDGAVRLLAVARAPDTIALLLERCVRGTPLGQAAAPPRQDEVIAGLLRRLHRVPPAGHPFRPLEVMCAAWAGAAERRAACGPALLDPGLVRDGLHVLRTFAASAPARVLLCTDLHAANVLAAAREPWLVVDPKPYVGDPAYDVVQHMLNCPDRLAAVRWALLGAWRTCWGWLQRGCTGGFSPVASKRPWRGTHGLGPWPRLHGASHCNTKRRCLTPGLSHRRWSPADASQPQSATEVRIRV